MTIRTLLLSTLVLLWVIVGHARVLVWHDNLWLWHDAYEKGPTKARILLNYGRMLQDFRSLDDPRILPLFHEGQRLAARLDAGVSAAQQRDWYALALANEARYWRLHGDLARAEDLARRAVDLIPLPFVRAEFVRAYLVRHCQWKDPTWQCPSAQP